MFRPACINRRSARLLQRIARLTGIEQRYAAALDFQLPGHGEGSLFRPPEIQPNGPGMSERTAAFEKASGPLVLRALAEFPPDELGGIGTLITASCTHASAPGLERAVFAHTPIPHDVHRWNLGFMGCSAGLAAVRLLHQMHALERPALVIACELSSLHFQYTDEMDQMTANLLFADGAAAVLVSAQPPGVRVLGCRSMGLPAYADQMVWLAADSGLRLRLSQELPDTIAAHLPAALETFLGDAGVPRAAIDHWLVHPGGPQILDAAQDSLHLPPAALDLSRAVLRRYGNMSSPTVFFILRDLLASGARGHVLAIAFGPGLTIEFVLLHIG